MFGNKDKAPKPVEPPKTMEDILALRAEGRQHDEVRQAVRLLGASAVADEAQVVWPSIARAADRDARIVTGPHPAIQMVEGVPQAPVESAQPPKV